VLCLPSVRVLRSFILTDFRFTVNISNSHVYRPVFGAHASFSTDPLQLSSWWRCVAIFLFYRATVAIGWTSGVASVNGSRQLICNLYKSKSKQHYDWRSVSQCVSVSARSGICDQIFIFSSSKLLSCLCGAPALTRGRVCLLSVSVYSSQSVCT
jgi:hypothetical protein